jgi:sugar O-acyltransferase (sialic acid O-acetyltransferase NeuD family)
MNSLLIIGAGGHGKVVADIAKKLGLYKEIAFLDDSCMTESLGLKVIGKTADAQKYIDKADIFVAIGDAKIRKDFVESLSKKGAKIPTFIHPSAVIGSYVKIGKGSVVMAGAVINACATLGEGCIVNTCSSVDHDCIVGDYAHISVGARVAGTVNIGANVFVGAGAVIKNNVKICGDCVIGAGAVVVKDIAEKTTYIGIPAKKMR